MDAIISSVVLCDWILSLGMFHVNPCLGISQYFVPFYAQIIFHCIVILVLFIRSSVDGPLPCFYLLTIINNAAINIHEHINLCVDRCFHVPGYIPRGRIAGSCHNSMFNNLRNCQTFFKVPAPLYVPTSCV